MAWPYTNFFEVIVAATTTAKKSLADALQQGIWDLFSGNKTIDSIDVSSTRGAGLASTGMIRASDEIRTVNGPIVANGAGGVLVANIKMMAITGRSSATPGAGQSVAAGEVWKDTAVFAYARIKQTGANAVSVTRSLNLASAPTEVVSGKYVFALQTAATNGLVVEVTVAGASFFMSTVRPDTLTTSAFQVWLGDAAGSLSELAVNDELMVTVYAY